MPRVIGPQAADVGVYSFGDKVKSAHRPIVNYLIQVAGLRDPQSNRDYRKRHTDGRADEILTYVGEDPRVVAITEQIKLLAHTHLRSNAADGKWLSFGIMDHHGTWTSVAVAEIVGNALSREGYKVNVAHYDLTFGSGK